LLAATLHILEWNLDKASKSIEFQLPGPPRIPVNRRKTYTLIHPRCGERTAFLFVKVCTWWIPAEVFSWDFSGGNDLGRSFSN
jgi:hypothetical protein